MVTPRTSQRRNGRRGRERGASIVMEQVCVCVERRVDGRSPERRSVSKVSPHTDETKCCFVVCRYRENEWVAVDWFVP